MVINNYKGQAQYFVNQVADGHWLRVRLRGHQSNRDGVGAILRIRSGEKEQVRVVTAGDGYASQYSRVAHFGLGAATSVEQLEVIWPSGKRQIVSDVEVDHLIELDEAARAVEVVRGAVAVERVDRIHLPGTVCMKPPDDDNTQSDDTQSGEAR